MLKNSMDIFRTNPQKETEGVLVPIVEDFSIRVRRMYNPEYRAYVSKRMQAPGADAVKAARGDEFVNEIVRDAVARHVLVGWSGLKEGDNKNVPYTPERALEMINEFPEFYRMVREIAEDINNFRDNAIEATVKN